MIFGRDDELAILTQAIDDTLAGTGRVVLLRGQAGIGKSRLAEQTLELARDRGLTVLSGQAHPLHTSLAYAPVVEAIRPFGGELTSNDNAMRLLRGSQAPGNDPDLNRTRMFEAVALLVRQLVPAVFFIDDLHWADRGTIELINYIAQGVRSHPVLVLAAYRPGEATGPLDDLAVSVRRNDTELSLEPLADSAVAQLAEDLLGTAPTPEFLGDMTKRAKGVPLFVTALVHSGFQAAGAIPAIVRDVVLGRLHQLDETERHLVETMAVAGDASTDLIEPSAALRRLIANGLVTEHTTGRRLVYRLAHPLYAEVAYAELTLGERRLLHASVLAAIERTDPDDVLALAPHYHAAGHLVSGERAARIMADAGWRALAMRAPDEAIRYLEAAAEIADPEDVPMLTDGIGRAYQGLGQFDRAVAAWQRGLTVADELGLEPLVARLRFRLALLNAERQDTADANERLRAEAKAITSDFPDAMVHHFVFVMRHDEEADLREVTAAMARLARDGQPADAQAVGHLGKTVTLLLDQDFAPALAEAETAMRFARQCERQSPFYLQYISIVLSPLHALNGDIPRARAYAEESLSTRHPMETPTHSSYAHYVLSFTHYLAGDLAAASRANEKGVAQAAGMPRFQARMLAQLAFLQAESGDLGAAEVSIEQAQQAYRSAELGLVEIITLARAAIAFHRGESVDLPEFRRFAVFGDPYASTVRPLFMGLLTGTGHEVYREFGPQYPLTAALADRLDGVPDAADRLDAMGAHLFALQARLEQADQDTILGIIEAFERAGAKGWANRARHRARSLGLRMRTARSAGPLSKRETEVVRLLSAGLSNAAIAARLFVSERTVETHLRNSYAKVGLRSRVALARWAAENL